MSRPRSGAITPMWLAHHFPEDYDRCVLVGRRHLCRRCLVLYPLAFAVLFLQLGGLRWPGSLDSWVLIVLPLPAVVEFVLEHLGRLRYRPRRQVAVTVPLAVALGTGFAMYLDDLTSVVFWGVVALYGGSCALVALLGRRGAR